MQRFICLVFGVGVAIFLGASVAMAQGTTWVQIEARPTEAEAEARAAAYSGRLDSVNGFRLSSGWYAIALGPFSRDEAASRLAALRAQGLIPRDSFIADGRGFRDQFWPGDGVVLSQPAAPAAPAAPVVLEAGEETVAEARNSERLLTREERADLQIALRWDGFYNSAIDASFGRGTRNAMAAWQEANGYEPTGVLTTLQRRELLEPMRAAEASLDLRPYLDSEAGIDIDLPLGLVAFDRYQPPFAQFTPKTDDGVRVLLISQTGDAATLSGLYDVMQTLEIVPLEGERSLGRRSFTLSGQNDTISSYTYAELSGETVKGFSLIWPAGDERRRRMALDAMQASFLPTEGVLPDTAGDGAVQSVDLLAGLAIRKPLRTRSGFYVDGQGRVLTTAAAVDGCARITLDDDIDATVMASDAARGLALLSPATGLAPLEVAALSGAAPRLQSDIAVAGYSFGGLLGAATLTYGALADVRGLDGNEAVERLTLVSEEGDAGGPVLDASGAVLGILADRDSGSRVLPVDVAFATDASEIRAFLTENGVSIAVAEAGDALHPQDLAARGTDMTVLVSCWN